MVGVVILSLFVLLAVVQWGCKSKLSFTSNLPNSLKLSESVIDGLVGSQLISSILAVSCVTVAFCSNFLMVQDKANGTIRDLRISPVKSATLSLSYYTATLFSTLIICFAATGICLTYVPTAEICPCVDKKKLIIEDNAVPNKTSSKISRNKKNISASNIFQPTIAT